MSETNQFLEQAEKLARGHYRDCSASLIFSDSLPHEHVCTCGRDAEVAAIAKSLQEACNYGYRKAWRHIKEQTQTGGSR